MRILLVEDHVALARQVMEALTEAGFVVDHAGDGEEGHFLGDTEPYDAVVLDLGLPVLDGLTVLKRWRAAGRNMPVLILTARDGWNEKVAGLNAGGDDYLTKPFIMAELVARVQALVRRAHGHSRPEIILGDLVVDTAAQRATLGGAAVRLTGLEYRLLTYLALHAGQVVSKTELTEHLYAQDFDRDSNTLEVVIGRLRKKLGDGRIETMRSQGYRLATA
ncbi:MAG: response regulator transcription factor [Roseomonas sp.]|jgi:two-component system OmpR family response regulator|nr:response regulator transcription factor [Roseomonas sp.]MCA3315119.1 response regulator transcription factor [Roseomonas sp.]MCA3343415.1 response regulator transcription factor [Roseomonas sp.]